jgi:hypothetical protein
LVLRLIGLLLLLSALGASASAQEGGAPPRNAKQQKEDVEWAVALGGRFRGLHDPVVAAYALGRLAETVCAKDPAGGEELFRASLEGLRLLTPDAFSSARHRLPVPSFTALWKALTPAAAKCAPELQQLADSDGARAKMLEERQRAPDYLRRASSLVDSDPDRAEQLAEAAITASDPTLLDRTFSAASMYWRTSSLLALLRLAAKFAIEVLPASCISLACSTSGISRYLGAVNRYLPNSSSSPGLGCGPEAMKSSTSGKNSSATSAARSRREERK